MRTYFNNINADFTCKHCGAFVSAQKAASGVVNRNHCPYCLHSRHLDLFKAGDRLCACKGLMVPVGLTLKNSRDKYSHNRQGELMLVHRCEACGAFSINRIAADDNPYTLLTLLPCTHHLVQACLAQGIVLLNVADRPRLQAMLFGASSVGMPARLPMLG